MNLRILIQRYFQLSLFSAGIALTSCKTSGDIASGRDYVDPTEVKTVENAALNQNTTEGPETTNAAKEAEMARDELETVKQTSLQEQEKLKTRLAELEKKNQELADELNKTKAAATTPAPTPEEHTKDASGDKKSGAPLLWQVATKDLKAGKYSQAITSLEDLVRTYPKDKLAFAAIMNLAMAQYKVQSYTDAAGTFNQAIDKFPKKKELALAWFGQASALAELKQKDDSKIIFDELVKRYPNSNEAALTKKILKKKEKVPADLFALSANYPSISGY